MGMSGHGERIDDIAARWVAREDRAPLLPAERSERDAWLAEDVRHRGAHARAQAVFLRAGRSAALGGGFGADPAPAAHAAVSRRRWLLGMASAAGLVALAVGLPQLFSVARAEQTYETGIGEVLRVPLADGSVATLNSATKIKVSFDPERRLLLLERGEALLDVAGNKARPFIVRTGDNDVVAVGTSFSVRRRAGSAFDVLVREGVVAIGKANVPVQEAMRVRANHAVACGADGHLRVGALPPQEVGHRLAWRDGLIVFEGMPLADAAAEFARYSPYRIEIEDPEVASLHVVGVYVSTDPAGFTRAVASAFGLRVEPVSGGSRLLRISQVASADGKDQGKK